MSSEVRVMAIQESGEMYLENIWVLKQKNGKVRSIDIANYANFSKPSVSRAVGILKKDGFITVDKDGYIELTDTGLEIANRIYERHQFLSTFLKKIGVSEDTANADACKVEHYLSEETFNQLKIFVENMK